MYEGYIRVTFKFKGGDGKNRFWILNHIYKFENKIYINQYEYA